MYLWHGGLDKDIPISRARMVAENIPHCRAMYYPDESHISLIVNHGEEVVRALMPDKSTLS